MLLHRLTSPSCTNSPFSESFFPACGLCRWDTTPQDPLHMFHCIEEHFSGQGCTGGTLFRCLLNRRDIVSGFSKPHSLALTDSGSQEKCGAVLLTIHYQYPNIIYAIWALYAGKLVGNIWHSCSPCCLFGEQKDGTSCTNNDIWRAVISDSR